jgi:hypothetical protein
LGCLVPGPGAVCFAEYECPVIGGLACTVFGVVSRLPDVPVAFGGGFRGAGVEEPGVLMEVRGIVEGGLGWVLERRRDMEGG